MDTNFLPHTNHKTSILHPTGANVGNSKELKDRLENLKDLMADSKYRQAFNLAKALHQENPENQEVKGFLDSAQKLDMAINKAIERAHASEEKGDNFTAYRLWLKALEISPFDIDVRRQADQMSTKVNGDLRKLYRKIINLWQAYRFRKALWKCEKILELYPENKKFQTLIQNTRNMLRKGEELLDKSQEHFNRKNWEQTLEICKDCLFVDPLNKKARDLYEEAYIHWKIEESGETIFPPLSDLLNDFGISPKAPVDEEVAFEEASYKPIFDPIEDLKTEELGAPQWQLLTQMDISEELVQLKTELNMEISKTQTNIDFEGFST